MKKYLFLIIAFILTTTQIAFANDYNNPFMDVPSGHWAYSAISQLAGRGVISGYPDGLYKGKQAMSRYEMASVVARAVAYIDTTKADKQDVDMLEKLVVEFKDELDALGVRVNNLETDMGVFKERLGGWKLSGRFRLDANHVDNGTDTTNNIYFGDARLNFQRTFGENNDSTFLAVLRKRLASDEIDFFQFYARFPFVWDTYLTVGKSGFTFLDSRFGYTTPGSGRYSTRGWFDNKPINMFKIEKVLPLGNFTGYVSHGPVTGAGDTRPTSGEWTFFSPLAWNLFANLDIKLNENFGFGIGGQYLSQNDPTSVKAINPGEGQSWDNIFTGWIGADYKFLSGIALHGIMYYQKANLDENYWAGTKIPNGEIAWRLAFNIPQDILKFSSLYVERMHFPSGFFSYGDIFRNLIFSDTDLDSPNLASNISFYDASVWKIGASQQWNNKFSTWVFLANIDGGDIGLRQFGIGLEYIYNSQTIFGLNYLRWNGLDSLEDSKHSRIRFTTQISF